jgi:hypothetical protein
LWCGGGHLHKECPQKGNAVSTSTYCNCQLAEGEKAHPSTYRGYRHAKEDLLRRKSQRTPKTTTGRVFPTKLTTPDVSLQQCSMAGQRTSSNLRHVRWWWQLLAQCNRGSLRPCPSKVSNQQVSQFGLKMYTVSLSTIC